MSVPEVVTVGLPVVVPEYPIVGTFKITTPDPPFSAQPAPPPVFAVPSVPAA